MNKTLHKTNINNLTVKEAIQKGYKILNPAQAEIYDFGKKKLKALTIFEKENSQSNKGSELK